MQAARAGPELLRSALAAAALGWHVFPCAADGKRPALRGNWQELATTSAGQIRAWWARAPYNIGIACGPSGLVVIDLDLPHADLDSDDPDDAGALFPLTGADRLRRLARKHRQRYPGDTYLVDTPSGGCHLYFAVTGDFQPRNSAGAVAPYVDVRADGGYVVGAGSRVGGSAYTARSEPRSAAPLPLWLGRLITQSPAVPAPAVPPPRLPAGDAARARAYAMAALRAETERVAAARPGTRNDTLNRAAFSLGQLVAAGLLPPIPVITGLISAARHAGLSEQEASQTVRSGMAGGARKPRAWLPAQPDDPGGQLAGLQQLADPRALLDGGGQRRRAAEAAAQLVLDGAGPFLPPGGRGRQRRYVGGGDLGQAGLADNRGRRRCRTGLPR